MSAGLGHLYLVPAPLDFGCAQQSPLEDSMPLQTLRVAASLQHWVCENAKSTRAYLKRVGEIVPLQVAIQAQTLVELPREVHKKGDHQAGFDARPLLGALLAGHDLGLVSEAGMPAVADPGSSVVRAAHQLGITVVPLVGPVSLLLALASSGLNGQNFAFVGYVPSDAAERAQRVKTLESLALKTQQTQLFIETPYRNQALLATLLQTLQPSTRLATSSGLTLANACNRSADVKTWKSRGWALDNAAPTVFAIGP
ncbi:MAG: SAM-dependent methyltransferase [Rhodoferax sp.]|nr:SAM-dependent methyltransferase [Rhodoferax sp.]